MELFDRALALAPEDGLVLQGRIAALYAEGRIDEAIGDLAARLRRQPGWLAGHGSLSRLRWLKGERQHFAASFEAAVDATPSDVALWREWAETLLHANRFEAVLALVARARAAAGAHIAFDAIDAIATAENGEIEKADRLFAALGEIGHPTMAVRYLRHLLRAGRPDEAARFGEPWLAREYAEFNLPYLTLAWRLIGDARWEQVEGDPRLIGVYDLADVVAAIGRAGGAAARAAFRARPAARAIGARRHADRRATVLADRAGNPHAARGRCRCGRTAHLATAASARPAPAKCALPARGRCGCPTPVFTPITSTRPAR